MENNKHCKDNENVEGDVKAIIIVIPTWRERVRVLSDGLPDLTESNGIAFVLRTSRVLVCAYRRWLNIWKRM
ncbi:hypothetical protein ACOSQ2_002161 [Xanthoceras sorbifolium]